MTNKPTHSTISHGVYGGFTTLDVLETGATIRYCTDVILYDENGPIITNYTNSNKYEYNTLRPISTRAIEAPNWNNPDGFLIKETGTFRAQCEKSAVYLLFVHIDNVPAYARELSEYWEMYGNFEPGVIKCEFSLEGCTFARFVGNPRIIEAAQGVKTVVDQYEDAPSHNPIANGYCACKHIEEAEAFCRHTLEALRFYRETVEDVKNRYGIVELIRANGADQPIGLNDWYPIARDFEFLRNTYRLETLPVTPEDIWNS